ncbi:rCG65909 [Rattus norvegicus]|nr:rCG65909 [Rattus norvegicus]
MSTVAPVVEQLNSINSTATRNGQAKTTKPAASKLLCFEQVNLFMLYFNSLLSKNVANDKCARIRAGESLPIVSPKCYPENIAVKNQDTQNPCCLEAIFRPDLDRKTSSSEQDHFR